MSGQLTVLVPDPEEVLMPYAAEQRAALAQGAHFVISQSEPPVLQDAEVIITSLLAYPAKSLRQLVRCQLLVVYGIGYDQVDIAAATQCGIVVANTPTFCVAEVADHTLALTLSLARHIPWLDRQVRTGQWANANQIRPHLHRLNALTVGMIGLGNTAQRVIQRLSPFGCRILAHHPRRTAESIRAAGAQPTSLTELLQQSDIVSLHVPLTNETRHLINEQALSQMKPGAMLINTSRGAVIDEAALIRALQRDHLYGVALDVYEQEPLPLDHPLLQFDPQRVILSPHFAGGSQEALPAQQQEVANAITAFLQGHWPASTINPTVIPKTGVHLLRRR